MILFQTFVTMFDNKKILITGGTGMIGYQLCKLLKKKGADVTAVSLDKEPDLPSEVHFINADLRNISSCEAICKDMDMVFHLAGVTGSPKMTFESPSTFMVANLLINTNMLEAATRCDVKKYLFTSTYGVYGPDELMKEDDMWMNPPSDADKYAGWAKRMGELQVEANQKQFPWQSSFIVRPANVYGPRGNFDPKNSMVVASLIRRLVNKENPFIVWGDGSAIRDFIYAEDVARGMILVVENNITDPLNLGSGSGTSIKNLVLKLIDIFDLDIDVQWDTSKPSGDKKRILDTTKAQALGFVPEISLSEGLLKTINWYVENKGKLEGRFNAFKEK